MTEPYEQAHQWCEECKDQAQQWKEPIILWIEEQGWAIAEWHHAGAILTVYFEEEEDEVNYVFGWGLDIENQMEDGILEKPADILPLLSRLLSGIFEKPYEDSGIEPTDTLRV
jgi:hypothetical protein